MSDGQHDWKLSSGATEPEIVRFLLELPQGADFDDVCDRIAALSLKQIHYDNGLAAIESMSPAARDRLIETDDNARLFFGHWHSEANP